MANACNLQLASKICLHYFRRLPNTQLFPSQTPRSQRWRATNCVRLRPTSPSTWRRLNLKPKSARKCATKRAVAAAVEPTWRCGSKCPAWWRAHKTVRLQKRRPPLKRRQHCRQRHCWGSGVKPAPPPPVAAARRTEMRLKLICSSQYSTTTISTSWRCCTTDRKNDPYLAGVSCLLLLMLLLLLLVFISNAD